MWQGHEHWLAWEHQQALLHEAEQRQLLKLVQRGQPATSRYYGSALFWAGQRLTGWGAKLQSRYAPAD